MKLNNLGGYQYDKPLDKMIASEADLITVPKDQQKGVTCSSCQFFDAKAGTCKHPSVKLPVTGVMCCKFWKNPKQINSWE